MAVVIMTLAALFLIALGAVLNFAPTEIAGMLGFTGMPVAGVALQVLAGALLALGVIHWMARGAVGGVFGRPIGMGNMLFYGVSAFGLLRAANASVLPTVTLPLGVVTALFALGFAWLVIADKRPQARESR